MAIQKTLEMDFATELNRTYRIRIYDVRDDITPAEISAAIDQIITKNLFSGRELTDKVTARIITKETEECFKLIPDGQDSPARRCVLRPPERM